jgi:hypothetical protein
MERKIKLIWDFRGPDSKGIAEHHKIHLGEYGERAKLSFYEVGFEAMNDQYHIAYITVEEKDMKLLRDALRPHRGELA